MAPIENRRRTDIDLVQRTDKICEVRIVRGVARSDPGMHFMQVFGDRPVAGDAADARLPGMNMRIDEAGHDDHPRRIDDLGTGRTDGFADFFDLVPIDENIALGEIADLAIHRDNSSALDQRFGHMFFSLQYRGWNTAYLCPRITGWHRGDIP